MHEARANQLQIRLDEANAQIAQLEDELTVTRDELVAQAQEEKPPITITSNSPTTTIETEGGSIDGLTIPSPDAERIAKTEAETRSTGYTLAAIVTGVIGVLLVLVGILKRKR